VFAWRSAALHECCLPRTATTLRRLLRPPCCRRKNEPEWADSGPQIDRNYKEVCGMPGLMEMSDGSEVITLTCHPFAALLPPALQFRGSDDALAALGGEEYQTGGNHHGRVGRCPRGATPHALPTCAGALL